MDYRQHCQISQMTMLIHGLIPGWINLNHECEVVDSSKAQLRRPLYWTWKCQRPWCRSTSSGSYENYWFSSWVNMFADNWKSVLANPLLKKPGWDLDLKIKDLSVTSSSSWPPASPWPYGSKWRLSCVAICFQTAKLFGSWTTLSRRWTRNRSHWWLYLT